MLNHALENVEVLVVPERVVSSERRAKREDDVLRAGNRATEVGAVIGQRGKPVGAGRLQKDGVAPFLQKRHLAECKLLDLVLVNVDQGNVVTCLPKLEG